MNDHDVNNRDTHPQASRRPTALIAGAIGMTLAATVGGFLAIRQFPSSKPVTSSPAPITAVSPPPQSPAVQGSDAEVYWLRMTGNATKLVPTQVSATSSSSKAVDELRTAFDQLLAGPRDANNETTIPAGTKLRSLSIEGDSIRIDLTREFTTGGGTASMTGRLAQVIYTATSIKPNSKVWIYVEGKALDTLGGEGLELEQPLTRKSFNENFPL